MILEACSSLVLIQRTYDDREAGDSDREEKETGLDGEDEELVRMKGKTRKKKSCIFTLEIFSTYHLIDILRGSAGVEFVGLDHGLADRGGGLLDLLDNGRIIKDAAWDLAMPTTKTKDEVQSRLLLDVVVRKGAAVLQLFAGEDEALLVGRDALLVLDLGLDVVDGVGRLDVEGDGLAGQSLDENLCVERQVKIFIRAWHK